MDFEFTHNGLQYGTDSGSLKSFFDEIRHAAEMTHVDREIAKDSKSPSKSPLSGKSEGVGCFC